MSSRVDSRKVEHSLWKVQNNCFGRRPGVFCPIVVSRFGKREIHSALSVSAVEYLYTDVFVSNFDILISDLNRDLFQILCFDINILFHQKKGGNHERMEIFSTDVDNSNNDFGA